MTSRYCESYRGCDVTLHNLLRRVSFAQLNVGGQNSLGFPSETAWRPLSTQLTIVFLVVTQLLLNMFNLAETNGTILVPTSERRKKLVVAVKV